MKRAVLVIVVVALFAAPGMAQWIHHRSPSTPRTPEGKPNLTAPAPRTADGKPDLSGIWELDRNVSRILVASMLATTGGNFSLQIWSPTGAEIPMRADTEEVFNQRVRSFGVGRPAERCLPHSIPDAMVISSFKIVQNPGLTLILHEEFARFRQILTDGRKHPEEMTPAWFGYSVGKWDQDTFVVDTVGFNDRSWLDDAGHPHSEAMHTIERFHRSDFGHMTVEITIDDPDAYAKPWTIKQSFAIMPDTELIEDLCDNEKDLDHLVGSKAWGVDAAVAPEVLAKYAGSYEFKMGDDRKVLEVSVSGNHLKFFGTQMRTLSEEEFAGVQGSVRFERDSAGRATAMTITSAATPPEGLKGVRVR